MGFVCQSGRAPFVNLVFMQSGLSFFLVTPVSGFPNLCFEVRVVNLWSLSVSAILTAEGVKRFVQCLVSSGKII